MLWNICPSPTWVCAECGVDQVSLLVNAGHSSVAESLATLLYLPVTHPALQGSWSWWIREDASRPVPICLGQKLITGTRPCLFQWVQLHIQAMLLLFTATWVEDGQKNENLLGQTLCGMLELSLSCHIYRFIVWFKHRLLDKRGNRTSNLHGKKEKKLNKSKEVQWLLLFIYL